MVVRRSDHGLRKGKAEAFCGGVAQMGERLLCTQEVIGSIPFTSTTPLK
jgi:hypothetical protein